jgi:hypothetical protein
MNSVTIEQGSTAIYLYCLASGRLAENPSVSIFRFLQQHLTEYEFDPRTKTSHAKYFYYRYDKENGILYLPVNIIHQLEQYFKLNLIEYKIIKLPPINGKIIAINKVSKFIDRDYQVDSIQFLAQPGMRALELQTGCICGQSKIFFSDGNKTRELLLEEAYNITTERKRNKYAGWFKFIPCKVQSFDGRNIFYHDIEDIVYSGVKFVIRVTFDNNTYIDTTFDHLLMTELGWIDAELTYAQMVVGTNPRNPIMTFYKQVKDIRAIGLRPTYDIICKDPHRNFVANGTVVHNSGKTYIAIRALTELNKRGIIIVPASLMTQWIDSLSSMCDAKIGVIRGSNSIYNIINKNFDVDVDIFVASISTIKEYAMGSSSFDVLPPMPVFINELQIGVKIIDECHLNFNANTITDIMCGNIEHNIYLSATYIRSSHSSNMIFKKIFPDEIKYDGGVDYSRYVNITEVGYSFGDIDDRHVCSKRGYSQFKYEKYLMKRPQKIGAFLDKVLKRSVDEHYVTVKEPGEKLLIIVGLNSFANVLVDWFQSEYPNFNTIGYFYETDDEVLNHADVIISTTGSCGTGKDIGGLRSMILFISFNAESTTLQTIGRLRKMKNTPEFVYLVNRGIRSHQRHAYQRRKIYKTIGKSFNYLDYIG